MPRKTGCTGLASKDQQFIDIAMDPISTDSLSLPSILFFFYSKDRYEKSQNSTVMLKYHLTHTNSRRELFDDKETKRQKKKKKNKEKYSEITMSTEEKQMTVRLSRLKNPFRSSSCLSSDSLMVS